MSNIFRSSSISISPSFIAISHCSLTLSTLNLSSHVYRLCNSSQKPSSFMCQRESQTLHNSHSRTLLHSRHDWPPWALRHYPSSEIITYLAVSWTWLPHKHPHIFQWCIAPKSRPWGCHRRAWHFDQRGCCALPHRQETSYVWLIVRSCGVSYRFLRLLKSRTAKLPEWVAISVSRSHILNLLQLL